MSRIDVTNNEAQSFWILTATLDERGFAVDHYHAVDEFEDGTEVIVHISPDGDVMRGNNPRFETIIPTGWKRLVADGTAGLLEIPALENRLQGRRNGK